MTGHTEIMDGSEKDSSPRVSICMPVLNGENFIEEALDSIGQQSFIDYELIVTDNASTDATGEIVRQRSALDARIRYFRNEANIGAAENYNLGFRLARGTYVKWMAHDDTLSPNFIRRMVAILDGDPVVSIAFARTQNIDAESRLVEMQGYPMHEILDDEPRDRFFRGMTGAGSCFPIFGLFRAQQLAQSSLHLKYYGSDRALLCEMLLFGKLRIDEGATFNNRIHLEQSISIADRRKRAVWQSQKSNWFSTLERTNLLVHLFKISGRHSDLVAPFRLRLKIVRYALRPIEMGRYGIELVQLISPQIATHLRPLAGRLWAKLARRGD